MNQINQSNYRFNIYWINDGKAVHSLKLIITIHLNKAFLVIKLKKK